MIWIIAIVAAYLLILLLLWIGSKFERDGSAMPLFGVLTALWISPFALIWFKVRPPTDKNRDTNR